MTHLSLEGLYGERKGKGRVPSEARKRLSLLAAATLTVRARRSAQGTAACLGFGWRERKGRGSRGEGVVYPLGSLKPPFFPFSMLQFLPFVSDV